MSQARLSACMLISHKGHNNTIQVYSVTVMSHVIALQDGQSSQGTSEHITPVIREHCSGATRGLIRECLTEALCQSSTVYVTISGYSGRHCLRFLMNLAQPGT